MSVAEHVSGFVETFPFRVKSKLLIVMKKLLKVNWLRTNTKYVLNSTKCLIAMFLFFFILFQYLRV